MYKLYQKLISAMAGEGIANASDIDMNATLDNQSYGKVSTIINAIISKIQTIVSEITTITSSRLERSVVQSLPTTDISDHTIYLVPKTNTGTRNIYDEYMYINGAWEKIGDTEVDLTNYVQKPSTTQNNKAYIYMNGSLVVVDASDIPFVNSPTTFDASVTNVELALEWLDDHKAPMPDNIADNKRYVMYNGVWTELQIQTPSSYQISYDGELSHLRAITVQAAIDELVEKANVENILYDNATYFGLGVGNVEEALDFLGQAAVGSYSVEDVSDLEDTLRISEFDNGLLPLDGYHYNLGSISSLMFSNEMLAMKIGTTVVFTASDDFVVKLPYSYTDNGTTINPEVPARMVGMDKLECLSGNQYVITITTVCGADGGYINLFNMQQLITPTATSNNIS